MTYAFTHMRNFLLLLWGGWSTLAEIGKIWQILAEIGRIWLKLAEFGRNWQILAELDFGGRDGEEEGEGEGEEGENSPYV